MSNQPLQLPEPFSTHIPCGIHACPLLPYGNKVNSACYKKAMEYYEHMGISLSTKGIKASNEILLVFKMIVN